MNQILLSDCVSGMKTLDGESVDLCVTSPPYDDLRSYNDSSSWNFDTFKDVAAELYRVMKIGGVVVWVIGDATVKGSETGSSFRQAVHFMDLGFLLHDTMIYEKNGSPFPAKRTGNRYQILQIFFVINQIDGQVIHTLVKELLEQRMENLRIDRLNPSQNLVREIISGNIILAKDIQLKMILLLSTLQFILRS